MKKILVAIIATAMTALGLVAVAAAPASAACSPDRYTVCFNTTTSVVAPIKVKRGRSVPISVSVVGPVDPKGTTPKGVVTVTVISSGGGVVYTSTNAYVGGTITFVTQTLFRKGRYAVTATFSPDNSSNYNGSSASTTFKVKKKKRRN